MYTLYSYTHCDTDHDKDSCTKENVGASKNNNIKDNLRYIFILKNNFIIIYNI